MNTTFESLEVQSLKHPQVTESIFKPFFEKLDPEKQKQIVEEGINYHLNKIDKTKKEIADEVEMRKKLIDKNVTQKKKDYEKEYKKMYKKTNSEIRWTKFKINWVKRQELKKFKKNYANIEKDVNKKKSKLEKDLKVSTVKYQKELDNKLQKEIDKI